MTFVERGRLLVPEPAVFHLFVDESGLYRQSGEVQAAVLVPGDWYSRTAIPEARGLLRRLGRDAKEFKASSITHGNLAVYREFLRLFIGALAAVGKSGNASSIVTVHGRDALEGPGLDRLTRVVQDAFLEYGVTSAGGLLREFCRQLTWIGVHSKHLITDLGLHPLRLTFDTKHKYAEHMREKVRVMKQGVGEVVWERSALMNIFANTSVVRAMVGVNRIDGFEFKWSESEFGLQAADLLSNLFNASLRCAKGASDDATLLRCALLSEFLTDTPDKALLDALELHCSGKVACIDSELVSRCQLIP